MTMIIIYVTHDGKWNILSSSQHVSASIFPAVLYSTGMLAMTVPTPPSILMAVLTK